MATRVVSVNDILEGHVGLDLECFDRIYLNGWVPTLQVPGHQVVSLLTVHLGFPIPSPAILERIGLRFRKAVTEFAAEGGIPVIRFAKGDRKLEVMRPHLDRLARAGRIGVAAIGVAQEFQRVFTGTTFHPDEGGEGLPRFGYAKADRRVTGVRVGVCEGVCVFSVSDQDLAQWPRVCQAPSQRGGDRLHRAG
jgi:hypothetical protein